MTILAAPCRLCGETLRILVNRNTKDRSNVWACPHCDIPCPKGTARCVCCRQVDRALRK